MGSHATYGSCRGCAGGSPRGRSGGCGGRHQARGLQRPRLQGRDGRRRGGRFDYNDLLGGFVKYDAAKGPEAVTYNLLIKDLKLEVPAGYTSTSWSAYYNTPAGEIRFVRAVLDFSGSLVYEYGQFTSLEVSGVNAREGATTGKMFEGPDGVIQIVVPDGQVKPGDKLEQMYAIAGLGRALPNQATTPTRGLASTMDSAPDDEEEADADTTVTACETAVGPIETPTVGSPQPGGETETNQPQTGDRALPATLVTKSVKRRAIKRKTLKLKLRSSEPLTDVDAQLRKRKKVFGTGSLAKLDGAGTLKLKVSKLKRGKYVLDLAGTVASGNRLITAARLKVK